MALMRLLGFANRKLDFSAGFVLELRMAEGGEPEVRLYYHGAEEGSPDHFAREFFEYASCLVISERQQGNQN